jgi:hypothetical protein
MEISSDERERLKRYLIGELGEDDQREIGERMFTDDQYLTQVEMLADDLIDDYLSGSLSPDEQSRFETHFLNPPIRQEKMQFARALRRYVKTETEVRMAARASEARPAVPTPASGSRLTLSVALKVAAGATVVILAGFALFRLFVYESDLQRGQDLFKDLYKSERPLRSRISTLDWAPFVDVRTGAGKRPDKDDLGKQSAGLILKRALKEDPSPASEHAYGLFSLTTKSFVEAVAHLSSAAKGDSKNAAYHSDLGAALLEKSESERLSGNDNEASRDLSSSLEELEHALSISSDFEPALFNRALCLEGMQRWRDAEGAWLTYLAKDPSSQWTTDASKRLDSVRQKL